MKIKNTGSGGKGGAILKTVLVIFAVVIVGLVITIFLVKLNEGNSQQTGDDNSTNVIDVAAIAKSSNAALRSCDEIEEEFLSGSLTFDESQEKFAVDFEEGDDLYKVYFAMCYAEFVYEYTEDANLAVGVMEKAESLVGDSVATRVGYYIAMRDFYQKVGNVGQEKKYEALLDELGLDDSVDLEVPVEDNGGGE